MFSEYVLYTFGKRTLQGLLQTENQTVVSVHSHYYPQRTTQELLALAKQHKESSKKR
jgi:hypothetical protein